MSNTYTKQEIFESVPVPKALMTMAVPTIISQLINLIYNMVDAFFIGRTGNSYMLAATSITLTLIMLNAAFSNLFGVGGGSLVARLMGTGNERAARRAGSYSCWGSMILSLLYSAVVGIFMEPMLYFLGASDSTILYAKQYTLLVIVIGALPGIFSLTLAHLLRNAGYSSQASLGLSGGGILNIVLDPLFMFVILPKGQEVVGAALATLISNVVSCVYLLCAYIRASRTAPLGIDPREAVRLEKVHIKSLFAVGVPSMILTGLFDLANICVNILASAHSDLVLAGMGIVMKIERIPNAVNLGICQGMLPIVAYNYSSGNHARMKQVINAARISGIGVSVISIILLELLARPVVRIFMSTSAGNVEEALITIGFAVVFLRIRCIASPSQFLNYHTSFCMQAMGKGLATMIHAVVRELVFYIPLMFILDRLFGEYGLASALITGETLGAVFALILFRHVLRKNITEKKKYCA